MVRWANREVSFLSAGSISLFLSSGSTAQAAGALPEFHDRYTGKTLQQIVSLEFELMAETTASRAG